MLNIIYAECHKKPFVLSVIMLNVVMLSAVMLSVVTGVPYDKVGHMGIY
jgi:hypothetical protein